MRRRSGFTLIEMMIVLAIIAALAATLVPIAMNALNQAKVTQNLTDLESIRYAAMQYYYKNDTVNLANLSALSNYLEIGKLSESASYSVHTASATSLSVKVDFTQGNETALNKALLVQYPDTDETNATVSSGDFIATFRFE